MNSFVAKLGTNRVARMLRAQLRSSRLGRAVLGGIGRQFQGLHEEDYHQAMISSLRAGDVVWDIGANVGVYTRVFLDAVGSEGRVVAVEPSPESLRACVQRAENDARLTAVDAAIGEEKGTVMFGIGADATSPINRIGDVGANSREVRLITGDELLIETGRTPDLIKIDVEGFEIHALRGMTEVLKNEKLRKVFIEVHFSRLEASGVNDGPKQIAAVLEPAGFELQWIDFSHVVAARNKLAA